MKCVLIAIPTLIPPVLYKRLKKLIAGALKRLGKTWEEFEQDYINRREGRNKRNCIKNARMALMNLIPDKERLAWEDKVEAVYDEADVDWDDMSVHIEHSIRRAIREIQEEEASKVDRRKVRPSNFERSLRNIRRPL